METIDPYLGALEVLLVSASIAALIAAARRGGHGIRIVAFALPAVTAVTLAHPFGVMAIDHEAQPGPQPAAPSDPDQTRYLLGLVPPGPTAFRVYHREIVYIENYDNPTHTLRVRSWWGPGLFTNSSKVSDMCAGLADPCWRLSTDPDIVTLRPGSIGTWRLEVGPDPGDGYSPEQRIHSWTLVPGVTSWPGCGFWLVTVLMWRLIWRTRDSADQDLGPKRSTGRGSRDGGVRSPVLLALVAIPLMAAALPVAWVMLEVPELIGLDELPSGDAAQTALLVAAYSLAPAATMVLCSIRGVAVRRTLALSAASLVAVPAYQVAGVAALIIWFVYQTFS